MTYVDPQSGAKVRRQWSEAEKRALVAAAFAPGAKVKDVARQAGVRSGQIYDWRRDLQRASSKFAEIMVTDPHPVPSGPTSSGIEILLREGERVHISAGISPELAASVLHALVRR